MPHSVIQDVTPIFGLTDGGSSIHIVADIYSKDIHSSTFVCHLSTISSIHARWLSGNTIECITPARHASQADVCVSTGSILDIWSLQFLYISKLALGLRRRDSLDGTLSTKNAMNHATIDVFDGGVMVMPAAHDLVHRDHAVQEMSLIEARTMHSPGLETRAFPRVSNTFPTSVEESGGLLMLAGQDFSTDAVVLSGTWTVGHFISSVLIFLDIKSGSAGEEVVLFESGTTYRSHGKLLVYENDATVFSLQPMQGTLAGGTLLTVAGKNFVNSKGLSCAVGTFAPLSGRWLGSHTLDCVTPAHLEILVRVSITNVSPVFARESLSYRYRMMETLMVGTKLSELEFWKADDYQSLFCEFASDTELSNETNLQSKSDVVLFDLTGDIHGCLWHSASRIRFQRCGGRCELIQLQC